MAIITTDFAAPSVSRTRADRSSAGVVAGYIRELAGTQAQAPLRSLVANARPTAQPTVSAAADSVGASERISAARGRGVENAARRGQGRARGGCSSRGKRVLESY
jgi:hypothetical protein